MPVAWARALLWTLQLIPIAFVFRIRANQEYLMLAGFIVALYGTERARRDPAWVIVALLGFLYALSVKGMLALIGPPLCALWLLDDVRARATVAAGGLGWRGADDDLHARRRGALRTSVCLGDG